MLRASRVFALLLVALAPLAHAAAQSAATVVGRVTTEGGAPLGAVTILIPEADAATQSASDGRYRLVVPAARLGPAGVTLMARRIGFTSQSLHLSLRAGDTATQHFTLSPVAVQ